jgi:hypothetical protein
MAESKYLRPGFDFALAHAVEEAGEFLAAAGKTQRWGADSYNPELPPERRETNRDWMLREMTDLREALSRLAAAMTPQTARCVICDGTRYADYAGFAMDVCRCASSTPTPESI